MMALKSQHFDIERAHLRGELTDEEWEAHLVSIARHLEVVAELREVCRGGRSMSERGCTCDDHEAWEVRGMYDERWDRRSFGEHTTAAMAGRATKLLRIGQEVAAAWRQQREKR